MSYMAMSCSRRLTGQAISMKIYILYDNLILELVAFKM